jgi:hypothetical protein
MTGISSRPLWIWNKNTKWYSNAEDTSILFKVISYQLIDNGGLGKKIKSKNEVIEIERIFNS